MFKSIIFNIYGSSRTSGAHRIATHLRKEGWDCEVADFISLWDFNNLKDFCETRIDKDTKFIGFSFLFYNLWSTKLENLSQWIKFKWPHVYIFAGSNAWPSIQSNSIDYYFQGYSENAITSVCEYLFSNGNSIKFTVDDKNRKVILANVDYTAAPYKFADIIFEDRDYIEESEWLPIEFSRGCKFQCDFCNFPLLGVKGDYTRDSTSVEKQLKDMYNRFGVTNFVVTDETFNDKLSKITKFADVVEKLDFKPIFTGFIRADLLVSKPEQQEELLRMGFVSHFYGIESFNHESAKLVGKGMHPEKLQQGLVDIKNYFQKNNNNLYKGEISLIVGLPGESIESIEKTKQWLLDNWQGQAVQPFAIDIPKVHSDKNSLISKDYEKYGYTEISFDDTLKQKNIPTIYYDKIASNFPENIIWKNNQMDIFDAALLVNDLTNLAEGDKFSIGAWDIAEVGLPTNLHELFALSVNNADSISQTSAPKFLKKYIKKKIG
jgi:radical SAM superfamily enzyme YgiQ (UPF0313 family)